MQPPDQSLKLRINAACFFAARHFAGTKHDSGTSATTKANDGLKRLVFVKDDCGRVLIGLFELLKGRGFFLGDPFVCRFRSDIDIGIDPFAVRGTVS